MRAHPRLPVCPKNDSQAMIICATRAGEHSRAVHDAAVRMAVEQNSSVTFVHVLDGQEYLDHNESMKEAIRDEARWLINSLAHLAKAHAGAADLKTSVQIREGEPIDEIQGALSELGASALVIGEPTAVEGSTFTGAAFAALTQAASGLGAEVVLV